MVRFISVRLTNICPNCTYSIIQNYEKNIETIKLQFSLKFRLSMLAIRTSSHYSLLKVQSHKLKSFPTTPSRCTGTPWSHSPRSTSLYSASQQISGKVGYKGRGQGQPCCTVHLNRFQVRLDTKVEVNLAIQCL